MSGIGRRGNRLLGFAALVIGLYAQLNIFIPAVAALAIGLVLLKAKLIRDRLLAESVSVQGGQVVWMLIPVLLGLDYPAFRIELLGYALAVFVLAVHPRKWIAIVLILYQGFGVVMNAVTLWSAAIGSATSRALVVHVSLRLFAILLLVMLLRRGLPLLSTGKIAQVFE
jgi:hypothetical protein